MTLSKDFIAFRKGMVLVNTLKRASNISYAYSLQAELMNMGYMIDPNLLKHISKERSVELYNAIIPNLKELMGDGSYTPLYNGFPNQVMEMSDTEYFINQIIHYFSNGSWMPKQSTEIKPSVFEHTEYKMITLGDTSKFENIFTDIVSVEQSITPFDMEIVKWFVENDVLIYPTSIPFKENLCLLASMLVPNLPIKTPTDVLRCAVGMSGGDISLPSVPPKGSINRDTFKFKKFTSAERKYLMKLLENSTCDVKEMKVHYNRWIRLGEILHPTAHKTTHPKVFKAYVTLRNTKVRTWNAEVHLFFLLTHL